MEDLQKYVGKMVRSLKNDNSCPLGVFKCIGIKHNNLQLEDVDYLGWPWYAKPEFVEDVPTDDCDKFAGVRTSDRTYLSMNIQDVEKTTEKVVDMKQEFKVGDKVLAHGTSAYCSDNVEGKVGIIKTIESSLHGKNDEACVEWDPSTHKNNIVRLTQLELYVEPITFKKGDRVKATGKSYYGSDLSDGATGTVKDQAYKAFSGDMTVVVTWDNPVDRNFDMFLPDHLELVKPPKTSKVAKILTEKVMIGDVKCRKITGFENIATFDDIPDMYLRCTPFFYIWSNGGSEMVLKPDNGLRIHLSINKIVSETDFQYYVQQMKKAGERLGTINKKIRSDKEYLRSKLQSIGTRSAKRKLQELSGRERRFQKDSNHQIANWILSKTYDTIALEDLTHIRNGKKNKKLGKWSFAELRSIVEYKAAAIGKKVVAIDPRYTSRTCSKCGFQKKENRNGRTFKCKGCGFQLDADLNASRNIATFSRSDRSRLSSTSQS